MKRTEKSIKDFMTARGWINLPPDCLAKSINIEASELLELFQWSSPTVKEIKSEKDMFKDVQMELADVLIYCFQLSVTLGLDTEKIIKDKLALANIKYPAELMRKRSEGDSYATSEYKKIKKEYREKNGKR